MGGGRGPRERTFWHFCMTGTFTIYFTLWNVEFLSRDRVYLILRRYHVYYIKQFPFFNLFCRVNIIMQYALPELDF